MKTQINFKLHQRTKDQLRELAVKNKISQAVMLEKLIDKEYKL